MNTLGKTCYFVDEAGDLTLFNKRGSLVVGSPGISHTFMLGLAFLPDPQMARERLEALRRELLADPYFKNVPSMHPEGNKTAKVFHACKDLPEVRREVFRILPDLNAKVQVIIRRKALFARHARFMYQNYGHKITANKIYDEMVSRLFKNSLHKPDNIHITFAQRGKAKRTEAIEQALQTARKNFEKKWNRKPGSPTSIVCTSPSNSAGLQVIDYYLWALQRLYEMNEDRFFNLLADQYSLIMDIDDTRQKPYGQWYSSSNPLTIQKIMPIAG
jgi:hypothetical protein